MNHLDDIMYPNTSTHTWTTQQSSSDWSCMIQIHVGLGHLAAMFPPDESGGVSPKV